MKLLRYLMLPLLIAGVAQAQVIDVAQQNGQFSAQQVEAFVGDVIRFTNLDAQAHNVFSLGPGQMFDLGEQSNGEQRELLLNSAGRLDVSCGIHGRAKLTIMVREPLDHDLKASP